MFVEKLQARNYDVKRDTSKAPDEVNVKREGAMGKGRVEHLYILRFTFYARDL